MKLLAAAALTLDLLAAHPEARIEWWYYTGHLSTRSAAAYGFELTFFRIRLPDDRDLDAAHFAFTDPARGEFRWEEKLHRPFPGIAGSDAERLSLFNENWGARAEGGRHVLSARMDGAAISLALTPQKPAVLNGEKGISRKGPGADDYSHYVSIPRLAVEGSVVRNGREEPVQGMAWFDHEWGPGGRPKNLAGWDWFSIQLDDKTELMLYQLRNDDGSLSSFSAGTYFDTDGSARTLEPADFVVTPLETWHSPHTSARYPSGWRLSVASRRLDVSLVPVLRDQELATKKSTRVTYWEGACAASGTKAGRPVKGRAYVELTGYAGKDLP
jgi:predicted secreted hydrolase